MDTVRDDDNVIGALERRSLDLHRESRQLRAFVVRIEHRIKAGCEIDDRKPSKEEMRELCRAKYEFERKAADMWMAVNEQYDAWDLNMAIKRGKDGELLVVEAKSDLQDLLGVLFRGRD